MQYSSESIFYELTFTFHDNLKCRHLGNKKKPPAGGFSRCIAGLTFGELFTSAGLVQADLFALDLSGIPRHQPGFLENRF